MKIILFIYLLHYGNEYSLLYENDNHFIYLLH